MAIPESPGLGVDCAFVALRQRLQEDVASPVFRNIEATAFRQDSLRYHLVTDEGRAAMRARMRSWPGVPLERVWLHPIQELSPSTTALHSKLASQATGPGPVYLWKPLLHLVLPSWVERVVVLDLDVFLFSDIAQLWRRFERFPPPALIGLVEEQCPSYQEARALGGSGFNGGVQLLALSRMRASRPYATALQRYAMHDQRLPMKPGGIGWLGDQTLYSWMSVNASGYRSLFEILPCGWNRQIGTHMAGWRGFWDRHRCDRRCHLLHGNGIAAKSIMLAMRSDPSGARCAAIVDGLRLDARFRRGTPDGRMLELVGKTCCRSSGSLRPPRPSRRGKLGPKLGRGRGGTRGSRGSSRRGGSRSAGASPTLPTGADDTPV